MADSLRLNRRSLFAVLTLSVFSGVASYVVPILTQGIIDRGVEMKDADLVVLFALAQLMLLLSSVFLSAIQSFVVLRMANRIHLNLSNKLLRKFLRLPLSYFSVNQAGDSLQRLSDISRIESFVSSSFISILVAFVNMAVYSVLLVKYGWPFLLAFAACLALYLLWSLLFVERRNKINYNLFAKYSERYDSIGEFLRGMKEINMVVLAIGKPRK